MLTISLKLQLEQDKLSILDEKNNVISTEQVEWKAHNSQTIKLIVDNPIDNNSRVKNHYFVINNAKDEPIEQLLMNYIPEENSNGYFIVNSRIVSLLKAGSKINIGILYEGEEEVEDGNKEIRNSNTIPVIITNGTAFGITPEEVSNNSSLISQLLSQLPTGPAIAEVRVVSKGNGAQYSFYLEALYFGEEEWREIGECTASLETMGLITPRDNTDKGGGGKIGEETTLNGDKGGFAGGYQASAHSGAAIGEKASAIDGVAIGRNARGFHNKDSIAIGLDSYVGNSDGSNNSSDGSVPNYSIGIGNYCQVVNAKKTHASNIAIGYCATSYQSEESIAIGSPKRYIEGDKNYQTSPEETEFEGINGGYKNIEMSTRTRVNLSKRAVAIGYRAFVSRASTSTSIGSCATVLGKKPTDSDTGLIISRAIAIGTISLARTGGGIAIGSRAIAGALEETGDLIQANVDYETKTSGKGGLPSPIAIGYRAVGSTIGAVAIGKRAKAYQRRTLAIGEEAEAGVPLDSKATGGTMHDAVAIGPGAVSQAARAVQIGKGTNTEKETLKFRDTTIVKSGAVQVNLAQGITGILPIGKGGTGANSASEARRQLGIFAGRKKIEVNTETIAENGIEGTVRFSRVLSSVPKVVASLEFNKDSKDINPSEHHIIITNITTEGFTYKYNYTGAKKKFKPYVSFIAIVF